MYSMYFVWVGVCLYPINVKTSLNRSKQKNSGNSHDPKEGQKTILPPKKAEIFFFDNTQIYIESAKIENN